MLLTDTTQDINYLASFAESAIDIEQLIGGLGLVIGTVLAGIKGLISFLAIISSYNIEIALMTKKEQWKYVITNLAILAVSIWFLNVFCCFWCQNEKVINGFLLFGFISFITWGIICLFFIGRWIVNKLCRREKIYQHIPVRKKQLEWFVLDHSLSLE